MDIDDIGGTQASEALATVFRWDDPQILGYHHPAFQGLLTSILQDELRCLVVQERGRGLCGVMPYRRALTPYGTVINALPFFGANGGIFAAPAMGNAIQERLLGIFRRIARTKDIVSAVFYTPFGINAEHCIKALTPDETVVKFTQRTTFTGPPSWSVKRRGDIRRARERGYVVRPGTIDDLQSIIAIYAENCAAAGIPIKPASFLSGTLSMVDQLGHGSPMKWLVADYNGHVAGALLYGCGPLTASYILPCAAADEKAHQPIALLVDAAVAAVYAAGAKCWNFESSPEWGDSVFKYKERWGAVAIPYAVCVFYGSSGIRPSPDIIAGLRRRLPYHFIAPGTSVSGRWPDSVSIGGNLTRFEMS